MMNDPPFVPPSRPLKEGREYRLYFLDARGHITRSHEFLAADDAAAIKIAEAWREGRRIVLWERARMVKRWHSTEG